MNFQKRIRIYIEYNPTVYITETICIRPYSWYSATLYSNFENVKHFIEYLKSFKIHEHLHPNLFRGYRDWNRRPYKNRQDECSTMQIPSGRVTRAETWLTVYRSLYIRMLLQLVADFLGERLFVNFDAKFLIIHTLSNKSACEFLKSNPSSYWCFEMS